MNESELKLGAQPYFSVIVTAFNQEAFIREAVTSVLEQDFRDFECIVVDDGSADGTAAVLATIEDPRLRIFRQPNQGVSAARNLGIDNARGEIVAFLDGDDRWRPGRLSNDARIFREEPGVGLMFCNFVRFEEGTIYPRDGFSYYLELERNTSRWVGSLDVGVIECNCFETIVGMTELPAFFPTISVRRSVLGDQRFSPRIGQGATAMLEDWHFFPLLTRNTTVAHCRKVLVEVRRHPGCFTWDHKNLGPLKLGSFLAMRRSTLTPSQRRALRLRIGREYANLGYRNVERQCYGDALASFLRSGLYGRPKSLGKGVLVTCAAAMGLRRRKVASTRR